MSATTTRNVKPRPKATKAAPNAATDTGAKVASKITMTSALVPGIANYDTYVSREIVKGVSDQDVFSFAMGSGDNVLIYGPTGPGKTSAAMAFAAKNELPFYAIPSNADINPAQLFGKFIPMPDGTIAWTDGPVSSIARTGGVLLWNEINFTPDRIATVMFSMLDKRREITLLDHQGETIRAHRPNCWCDLPQEECESRWVLIIADMNPEYEGTRPLNKALRNRFAVQLNWDYDDKVEAALVGSSALLRMAKQLREDMSRQGLETPVSTNMLIEFERFSNTMSYDFAVMMFVNHFNDEERSVVKQVVDTHAANLRSELSADERKRKEELDRKRKEADNRRRAELEKIVDPLRRQKIDWAVHPEDPDSKSFLTIIDEGPKTKRGDDDDEPWGVYGVSWNWDDGNDVDVINTPALSDEGDLL